MRRYIHRVKTQEQIDPMNVPERTIIFKNTKPDSNPNESVHDMDAARKSRNQNKKIPESLSELSNSEKYDEAMGNLKENLDKEIQNYNQTHERLIKKSESGLVTISSIFCFCSVKESEMYLRKIRPRTMCLYSAASI